MLIESNFIIRVCLQALPLAVMHSERQIKEESSHEALCSS
jgi:hypothetical protein